MTPATRLSVLTLAALSLAVVALAADGPAWTEDARVYRANQAARTREYAPSDAHPGKYRVPVTHAIDMLLADPGLLKSVPIFVDPNATPADRGRLVFTKLHPCSTCHAVEPADLSVKLGPRLHGRWGQPAKFAGGSATFDEAYIRESIMNPLGQIADGFQPVMPPLALTEQQIADVIEYIKSLP